MLARLHRIARCIRRLPGLKDRTGLWDLLRGPYHCVLNLGGGVEIFPGEAVKCRIPAEYSGRDWETYEAPAVRLAADWARRYQNGLFLDIGSSVGFFSTAVLFANPAAETIAFDSDLASLATTRRFCRFAAGTPQLVYGFVTASGSGKTLDQALRQTRAALTAAKPSGSPGTTRYVCVEDPGTDDIPRNTLDDLFMAEPENDRPLLIKCDVEGAELLVLRGAVGLLSRCRPVLLLSVHPAALPQHGHSKDDVIALLRRLDYRVSTVSVDHEEHWWCTPGPIAS